LFPSHAYAEAGQLANEFRTFASSGAIDLANLRHVVLRAFESTVPPQQLREKLAEFSKVNSGRIDYLARRADSGPLLGVMHIRFDNGRGGFDLHMHFIWCAPPTDLPEIEAYLKARYSSVWIDPEPVRSAGRLAFYLARNVFPHEALAGWSDEAMCAAWDDTIGVKLIRRAGLFLKPAGNGDASPPILDHAGERDHNTVRPPSPESRTVPLSMDMAFSINQIACVVAILRHQAQHADGSFWDRQHAPFLDGELLFYVTDLEEQLGSPLFDRGHEWRPTRMGRFILSKFDGYAAWLARSSPLPSKSQAAPTLGQRTGSDRPHSQT
jgi:hypothetical protein